MYRFDYVTPESIENAVAAASASEDGKFLAGGQTLIPTMKHRLAAPDRIIDLSRLASLRGIEIGEGHIEIGAMTTHAEVAFSTLLPADCHAIAGLAGGIGDPAVRHRGTIGGSIANNDPAADYPAACLGLGATIITDRREIHADDFFLGLFETALEEDELIVKIRFPRLAAARYRKFRHPASRYAMVGVFLARHEDGVRVAVTGSGAEGVFRWTEAEEVLDSAFNPAGLETLLPDPDLLIDDLHASATYRAHIISNTTSRAVEDILRAP